MDIAYEKYGLDHDLVRLLVELDFKPVIHYGMKINRILFNDNFYRDWKIFIKNKRKEENYALF